MKSPVHSTSQTSSQKRATIVVLGAAVWQNGIASYAMRRRTLHAIQVFEHLSQETQQPPLMVLSGGMGKHPPSEAQAMAELCIEAGIDRKFLILEDQSKTTMQNAQFSAQLLIPLGIQNIIVVSDCYHLPRALMIFRAMGFQCTGSGPARGANMSHWKRLIMPLREMIAYPYYWVRTLTQKTRRKPG